MQDMIRARGAALLAVAAVAAVAALVAVLPAAAVGPGHGSAGDQRRDASRPADGNGTWRRTTPRR